MMNAFSPNTLNPGRIQLRFEYVYGACILNPWRIQLRFEYVYGMNTLESVAFEERSRFRSWMRRAFSEESKANDECIQPEHSESWADSATVPVGQAVPDD